MGELTRLLIVASFIIFIIATIISIKNVSETQITKTVYLFSSFRGNGEDGLHLSYSFDGLNWKQLNYDKPFIQPSVGGKLMRDPNVTIGPDGIYHMVFTTSWTDNGIGISHSKDLIDWSEQAFIPVMDDEPTARNCWAPELVWDNENKQYVIFWATTIPERFNETYNDKGNHRIYYTTTHDFKDYSKSRILYNPGFNVIDATISAYANRYLMIFKDETDEPPEKNLKIAYSNNVIGPWSDATEPFTPKGLWVEGPSILKVGDWWYVYFDEYTIGKYGAMRTKDFKIWENVSDKITFPKGTRHGTAFPVSNVDSGQNPRKNGAAF